MGQMPSRWIVAHGTVVWGLSRKTAEAARDDAWKWLDTCDCSKEHPTRAQLVTHPASAELLDVIEADGGNDVTWHVGEGGIAQPGAGSQRELFAAREAV